MCSILILTLVTRYRQQWVGLQLLNLSPFFSFFLVWIFLTGSCQCFFTFFFFDKVLFLTLSKTPRLKTKTLSKTPTILFSFFTLSKKTNLVFFPLFFFFQKNEREKESFFLFVKNTHNNRKKTIENPFQKPLLSTTCLTEKSPPFKGYKSILLCFAFRFFAFDVAFDFVKCTKCIKCEPLNTLQNVALPKRMEPWDYRRQEPLYVPP